MRLKYFWNSELQCKFIFKIIVSLSYQSAKFVESIYYFLVLLKLIIFFLFLSYFLSLRFASWIYVIVLSNFNSWYSISLAMSIFSVLLSSLIIAYPIYIYRRLFVISSDRIYSIFICISLSVIITQTFVL